jgi:riboflavin synthase
VKFEKLHHLGPPPRLAPVTSNWLTTPDSGTRSLFNLPVFFALFATFAVRLQPSGPADFRGRPRYTCGVFTGIVETSARVLAVADAAGVRRLTIASDWTDVRPGASVAINGVCLTAADLATPGRIGFDVIPETLAKTNLGLLKAGDAVHVERSLQVGARIDGHFVQGHVDGTGPLVKRVADGGEWRLTIDAPADVAKFLVSKGSICVDGVSLTIAALDGSRFDVALIPTTLQLTMLGRRDVGYAFNLEADVISKAVVGVLERRQG